MNLYCRDVGDKFYNLVLALKGFTWNNCNWWLSLYPGISDSLHLVCLLILKGIMTSCFLTIRKQNLPFPYSSFLYLYLCCCFLCFHYLREIYLKTCCVGPSWPLYIYKLSFFLCSKEPPYFIQKYHLKF